MCRECVRSRMTSPNILIVMTDEERYPPPYETETVRAFRRERSASWFRAGGQRAPPRRDRPQPAHHGPVIVHSTAGSSSSVAHSPSSGTGAGAPSGRSVWGRAPSVGTGARSGVFSASAAMYRP